MADSASSAAAAQQQQHHLQLEEPHAFHRNLPPQYKDENGVPFITKFAHAKARKIVELAMSIQLTEAHFVAPPGPQQQQQRQGGTGGESNDAAAAAIAAVAAMAASGADNNNDVECMSSMDDEEDDDEDYEEDEVVEDEGSDAAGGDVDGTETGNNHHPHHHHRETLAALAKKCSRLQAQISGLEAFKYSGITQLELCEIVLHLLKLVTCTVEFTTATDAGDDVEMSTGATFEEEGTGTTAAKAPKTTTAVKLHYENVGYICRKNGEEDAEDYRCASDLGEFERDMERPFALHSPAREVLLFILINILSNKGPLRSVSNTSIYPEWAENADERFLLILHWKPLLRMILRTAPYLDERKSGNIYSDANYRQSTILKRSVQLIRDARHFFDQGVRPPGVISDKPITDRTAIEVWDMLQTDVRYHSHTHACYRATIMLYLFLPSRCSSEYYLRAMPQWLESWTNIDRCPEYDFLWLALFCRARKHVAAAAYDWGPIRKRLLTHSQYWLQLPIGGAAMDKSFPRAANPRSRSCPPRLKTFTGASSSYEEGIDFVAKVVKLLVTSLGTGEPVDGPGNDDLPMSEGTVDILRFLSFATPYFNPSNLGSWTFTLGAFLHYFAYELCCRVGASSGEDAIKKMHPAVAAAAVAAQPGTSHTIPPHEIVALLDALLPLCQQAIYSKNGHVGRAGEAAMLYLVQIDPARATPAFIDFAARALDIAAVNLSHQAPAALSALTRLVQPALRSDATVLLLRLPEILSLTLAGIDSNDQNKTIRTLILYRGLMSWIPVGGSPDTWRMLPVTREESEKRNDGTMLIANGLFQGITNKRECPEYLKAIERLPSTSLLKQGRTSEDSGSNLDVKRLALEEATSALSDWALEFLDRVFGLLRASGEREKAGKTASGVATRHSTADVHQARNFSRVMAECLMQLFTSMDGQVHEVAVRSIVRYLDEETHPAAAKDTSLLCQAVAAARVYKESNQAGSPGLDALIPVLTDDFHQHSTKTVIYRVRCLAGAVRSAGPGVITHQNAISEALDFALSSDDRHLFKTGCKLLRHTLATLSESYPLSSTMSPRVYSNDLSDPPSVILGRSSQLHDDAVEWHVPDSACVAFAAEILNTHVASRLDSLCGAIGESNSRSKLLSSTDIQELRRCLRVVRYSMRGGAGLLLDEQLNPRSDDYVPHELASYRLLDAAGEDVKASILAIRNRLCSFMIVLSSAIASETLYPDAVTNFPDDDPYRKVLPLLSSDPKVCKEACDIALLLLTRRGAAFRSQEARTLWKAQKQVASDFTLCAQVDRIVEVLQSAAMYGSTSTILYKDGEDAGKTVPRRLLVTRVQLFHNSLQRNASFEIPRRLRRYEREKKFSRNVLFSVKPSLPETMSNLEVMLTEKKYRPLDAYEGVVDGLFALCCHSNTQVRASAISVVDYAVTRFGWIVAPRVPRMLSGLSLKDDQMNGKFGVPSCTLLVEKLNHQGKRKRLADAIKGVSSILSLSRAIRLMLGSWKMRLRFVETICGTDHLVSLLPAEEMQKIIHYLQAVFSPFRSSFYVLPRTSAGERGYQEKCISHVLDILSEKKVERASESDSESSVKSGAHWRKLLIASWFLLFFVDEDVNNLDSVLTKRIWLTCFRILENDAGQPLQRVALGLLGKIVALLKRDSDATILKDKMATESFCRIFGKALVYDHKEDSRMGGGHTAQWSSGVENILRDAARSIAPRTLFPFQRTSQSLGSFKVVHSQLVERILSILDNNTALASSSILLTYSKELASASPSEDQRNQQITSAEIFAGVCGSMIRSFRVTAEIWSNELLPHLEEVMAKTPFSLCGAYFDAIRYSAQFAPSESFYPMTAWLIDKVHSTLWQPSDSTSDGTVEDPSSNNGSNQASGTEGFTAQSKWLYLFSAMIIEMDETEIDGVLTGPAWFHSHLLSDVGDSLDTSAPSEEQRERSWKLVTQTLLPRLTEALGHPFDSCRDHIARCLFRICYSHRKMSRKSAAGASGRSGHAMEIPSSANGQDDPGCIITQKLASLKTSDISVSYKDSYNALSTARRFVSYCVHLGEAKFEYSDYVIPLLPLAFEALNSSAEDSIENGPASSQEDSAARRALEAEVIKGYRYMISEVSITPVVSYGRESDIPRVLDIIQEVSTHSKWQVRHAAANFVRCFQGGHKYLFLPEHTQRTTAIVTDLLADERREVSSAAMAALTGILAASPTEDVQKMVKTYAHIAATSKMKKSRKGAVGSSTEAVAASETALAREKIRSRNQQVSVFFLCATIMSQPYDTPAYVPEALAAISKHSFERNAPLGVRDTVKKCCAEYKRTHMSDNWEVHRNMFSQEQLEAFEDVVSTPHYYA